MMRVVLDANVLVSALISAKGAPAQILLHWQEGKLDLVASAPILGELERVLHYPRLQERYDLPEELIQRFLQLLAQQAILVEREEALSVIERDPSDNRYLECAVAGEAEYIVSGDGHLLDLKEYRGIQIFNPREFLALLKLEGEEASS